MNMVCKVHAPESSKYNFPVCVGAVAQRTWATEEKRRINVRVMYACDCRFGFQVELDISFQMIKLVVIPVYQENLDFLCVASSAHFKQF